MRFAVATCATALSVFVLAAQTIEVGTGAPTEYIRTLFQNAYSRGVFSRFAELPPAGAVRRFGSTGLIQEFNDATKASGRMALVKANAVSDESNPYGDVYQVLSDLYSYYSTVGVTTAGYPLTDTQYCPSSACQFQTFTNGYALFAYSSGANEPQNITVRSPFYARWVYFGGISTLGAATSAETSAASSAGGAATIQSFQNGIIFNITSGALSGRLATVRAPIYALYASRGGYAGPLGYPTSDEITLQSGRKRQVFEGGAIEYDPGSAPVVRPPVQTVVLRPSTSPVQMNLGDTLALEAVVYGSDGSELTDRPVAFTTTNGRVVTVQTAGQTATVRAVGGGTARVTATSEGKTSAAVDVVVTSQCCSVGEGAPTSAIQQMFQDAVARTRIRVRTPGPERVRRAGAGYVQELQGAETVPVRYLIAMADSGAQAFVLTGLALARWEELGGAASVLGFPTSDAAASGRQMFEGAALAGSPLQVVRGSILNRWAQGGYEAGASGAPVGDASPVTTFSGVQGSSQSFEHGLIVGGPTQAYFIPDVIASRWTELGGALSDLGFPTAEATGASGQRQTFEGGYIEAGAAGVQEVLRPRVPAVVATPSLVLPGSRIRLTVSGFARGATIRVSVTGQPDFLVQSEAGAYAWEARVASNAQPGAVAVRAVDVTDSRVSAQTTYRVASLAEARLQFTKASGDAQSGAPGGTLPVPLTVRLVDGAGNPVSGSDVRFTASPGAQVSVDSATTGADGTASTRLILPSVDGVALVTAECARQVVTFSARAAGGAVLNFPKLVQAGTETIGTGSTTIAESGALLTATAAMLRYYQNRGEAPQPYGAADASQLNGYLKRFCTTDVKGTQYCDGFLSIPGLSSPIANLWRVPGFVGGGLRTSVERPDASVIRALVAGGSPLMIALSLTAEGAPAGSHFVIATGIEANGSIQIHDPSPQFGRGRLEEYTSGFSLAGVAWKGSITGVIRFVKGATSNSAFLVGSTDSAVSVISKAGQCGGTVEWPESAARPGGSAAGKILYLSACDGDEDEYQIELPGAGGRAVVTDLADAGARIETAGGRNAVFRAYRPGQALVVEPQQAQVRSIANAATFTPDLAPGSLASISGSGLGRTGSDSLVLVGGRKAQVVSATPFELRAQLPFDLAPGTHALRIEAAYGSDERNIEIRPVAPAIFRLDADRSRGAVVNGDGSVNAPANPAKRGSVIVIYATGLGAVIEDGSTSPTAAPVSVVVRGQEMRASFAGLAPGLLGVYQVNLVTPVTISPGLSLPLWLRQAGIDSAAVSISVE